MSICRRTLIFLLIFLLIPAAAHAATIPMGPNGCALADAIRSANTDNAVGNCAAGDGDDVIVAPDGWAVPISQTLPTIDSNITLRPESDAGLLTVSGDFAHKILRVNGSGTRLTLFRVALVDGSVGSALEGGGAALDIGQATVTVLESEIARNKVNDNTGSAVHIENGTLIIDSSVVRDNFMRVTGNFNPTRTAVFARNSTVEVIDSTFRDNLGVEPDLISASIFMDGGVLLFENSLIDEFRYGLRGEGAAATIINSTFDTSFDPGYDDDLIWFVDTSSVTLRNVTLNRRIVLEDSILSATNTMFSGCDFDAVNVILDAGNFNRIGNCRGAADGQSHLLPLADNGGPSRTRALGVNSDLIDAGDTSFCEPFDQRGVARVFACDIGAYEEAGAADLVTAIDVIPPPPYVGDQELAITLSVTNDGPALATAIEVDAAFSWLHMVSIGSPVCPALPCVIPFLEPGQMMSFPVQAFTRDVLNQDWRVEWSARSTAGSTHVDPDESDPSGTNFSIATGAILAGADLSVRMDLITPGPYFVGQAIEHDITVRNLGPRRANQIELDFLADGMSVLGFSGCPQLSGQRCTFSSLSAGADVEVRVTSQITESQFNAEAEVMADEIDIAPKNNRDDLGNGGGVQDADLSVDILLLTAPPYYGDKFLEFEIKLSAAQNDVSNILIDSILPGGFRIGVDNCNFLFPCRLPITIPAGTSITLGADWLAPIFDPDGPATWTHTVVAFPGENELDPSNNTVSITKPLVAAADLAAQLSLETPPPYNAQQEIEYRLRVVNGGLSNANAVDIVVTPDNLELQFASGLQCSDVNCQLSGLDRFNDEIITLVYRVEGAGDFNLVAEVEGLELDPVPANNIDSEGGTANALPNIDVIFTSGFEPPDP